MPNARWDDDALEREFELIRDTLLVTRDLPTRMAIYETSQQQIREEVKAVNEAQHQQWNLLTSIQVKLATLNTKMAFWAGLGSLAGSAVVGVVVALLASGNG